MESYEELVRLVEGAREDVERAEAKGNKAAGTRARKTMQDIKKAAQTVREDLLKLRNTPEGGTPSPF